MVSKKPRRSFSIELNSKHQIKNLNIPHEGQKERVLMEGTFGALIDAVFTEDVVLEIVGTEGIIRVDLQANEIKKPKGGN